MPLAWAEAVYLVQVLVPIYDDEGKRFPVAEFDRIRGELTKRFGGLTAYSRAPAQGAWRDDAGRVHHDDVIVVEVMVDDLDRRWWGEYRAELADRFRQESFVVRATGIETL